MPGLGENVAVSHLDRIDRDLVRLLLADGRATYQDLAQEVRLSANTVADRVRRLRSSGVIRGYRAELDPAVLGRALVMVSEVRLGESVLRREFEASLADVPQVVAGSRLTGDYDYELRVVCRDAAEFEGVVDRLRQRHGVRSLRSRMVLHDIPVDHTGLVR
jgi:Lrp/AsnC family leucine-responsive transcriptional regulator